MRIAVVSDIHGNIRALNTVLADIDREAPDLVISLGDCLSGPLQAAETADLLMERGIQSVRGNHDRQLIDRPPEAMALADRQAAEQLLDRHRAWLRMLPGALTNGDVLFCHGTPESDLIYCLETVTPHGIRLASRDEIEARLGTPPQRLVLCGHSHVPRLVTARSGTLVVNPGSVGLQAFTDASPYPHAVEIGSPHARYVLLERRARKWTAQFRAIEYDWEGAGLDAEKAGSLDWAYALRSGFVMPA
jgi:putative phosphoesterase